MSRGARKLEVGSGDGGRRLDLFLADRLGLSRAQTRRLLARGAVRVAGRSVAEAAKGMPLHVGDSVDVAAFTRPEGQRPIAEPELALRVLAEGPGWLAIDKPAGMPVHPFHEEERGTVQNAVAARHPEVHGVGEGGLRSGVVHRLDVDTSGVLLVATRPDSWQRLRDAFAAHRVEKVYRAIVRGSLHGSGSIDLPLVMARHRPARVRVATERERRSSRGVRLASLSWRVRRPLEGATLVEVRPVTGHLHQIRVMLAALGHPVAGDRAYGSAPDPTGAERQMLHAAHVATDGIAADSPDPADFVALLERLRVRA